MSQAFSRTELLLGPEALEKLARSRVAVFGLGGVGGYVVEALSRSGVGALDLVDSDTVSESNLNRQILATRSSLGRYKTEVAEERVKEIAPACAVRSHCVFFLPETRGLFDFSLYDYVVDAIDTVTGKLALIEAAREAGTPLISSMGTGNRLDPSALEICDLFETANCPLARVMRRECRRRGITSLKVVASREEPRRPVGVLPKEERRELRRDIPGSTAFVPGAAGLLLASAVVRDLIAGP